MSRVDLGRALESGYEWQHLGKAGAGRPLRRRPQCGRQRSMRSHLPDQPGRHPGVTQANRHPRNPGRFTPDNAAPLRYLPHRCDRVRRVIQRLALTGHPF